jgi:nicotinamide-nucleotide amidase
MTDPTAPVPDIAELARLHGFTVGAAESLTGGAVSSALAQGEGAAEWYRGCVVSYSERVKFDLLGVTPGPVITQRCAIEMVQGATRVLEADATVSTTGAGGPDEEEGHPPGTVHVAVMVRGEVTCHELRLEGDPEEVVQQTTRRALELLLEQMRAAV